jgi:hypothetical protein
MRPASQPEVGGDEGSPQRRTFVCHAIAGRVFDAAGAQAPDGAPGLSVKCSPPHPPTSRTVQLDPITWLAEGQLFAQLRSEYRLITGDSQLAPVTAPHSHEHCAGPASGAPVPS